MTFSPLGERQSTNMSVFSCKRVKRKCVFILKQHCQLAIYAPLKKEGKTVDELKTRLL